MNAFLIKLVSMEEVWALTFVINPRKALDYFLKNTGTSLAMRSLELSLQLER